MARAYYSTTEVAEKLGKSRIAVFNMIKDGRLPAQKIGRNYIIRIEDVQATLDNSLTPNFKKNIDAGVKKVIAEYGQTLKDLAKE